MKVLTEKEYSKVAQDKASSTLVNTNQSNDGSGGVKKSLPEPCLWVLLHPENGANDLQNFEDVLKIDEIKYKRKCVDGIVKTEFKVLADFLISKGYELLKKVEK